MYCKTVLAVKIFHSINYDKFNTHPTLLCKTRYFWGTTVHMWMYHVPSKLISWRPEECVSDILTYALTG